MGGYDEANAELRAELAKHYPNGARVCDPFSGRAMIPLEAARLECMRGASTTPQWQPSPDCCWLITQ